MSSKSCVVEDYFSDDRNISFDTKNMQSRPKSVVQDRREYTEDNFQITAPQ